MKERHKIIKEYNKELLNLIDFVMENEDKVFEAMYHRDYEEYDESEEYWNRIKSLYIEWHKKRGTLPWEIQDDCNRQYFETSMLLDVLTRIWEYEKEKLSKKYGDPDSQRHIPRE